MTAAMYWRARRRVAAIIMAAALAALSGCAQAPEPLPANVEALGNDAYLFRSGDQRSLFVVTDDGVVVTDPLNADAASAYSAAVARVTRKPVRWVVYSHYHWDRVSGAQVFKEQGAQIVA